MFDWEQNQVCVAAGPPGADVLVCIRPERIVDEGGDGETVVWDDGSRQRAFPVMRVVDDDPVHFRFADDRGQTFSVRPMTAKLYQERVQQRVNGPALASDAAVRAFYLQARGW